MRRSPAVGSGGGALAALEAAGHERPAVARTTGYLSTAGGAVLPHGIWEVGLMVSYADDPLVLVDGDGDRLGALVHTQLATDIHATIGLWDRVQIGVDLPMILAQNGDDDLPVASPSGFGIGNLRLVPQVFIVSTGAERGLDLSFLIDLSLPTGDADAFQGESFHADAKVPADIRIGRPVIGLNLGYAIREDSSVRNLEVRDHLTWAAAARIPLGETGLVQLIPEFAGEFPLTADDRGPEETPMEARFAGRFQPGNWVTIDTGLGVGIVQGYGIPDWRLFVGPSFSPRDDDRDDDGIVDSEDACPTQPEDVDGFEDEDGCPDPDNDGDGLRDSQDDCPIDPEDFDGFEDTDGCPEEGTGLVELTCAEIIIAEAVYFETDSDVIEERSFELLDQVAAVLVSASYIRLARIEGHTDDRGDADYNEDLSRRRAVSVAVYLIKSGVAQPRLEAVGLGESDPIVDNETRDGRSGNRRVEFHIVEQDSSCAD